jgi:hypothetical protein
VYQRHPAVLESTHDLLEKGMAGFQSITRKFGDTKEARIMDEFPKVRFLEGPCLHGPGFVGNEATVLLGEGGGR